MGSPAAPLRLLLAAGPAAAGVESLLSDAEREARAGADVRVLFTDRGLEALGTGWPARLAEAGVRTSLCARSARARKVYPLSVPASVLWSSVASFLGDAPERARVWSAFP